MRSAVTGVCGYAYIHFHGSRTYSSVLAPRPVIMPKSAGVLQSACIECEVKYASHVHKSNFRNNDQMEKERKMAADLCKVLHSAVILDNYPKTTISVHVTVLQSTSSDFAATVNAAAMALLNAAVSMRSIPVSYSITLKIPADDSSGDDTVCTACFMHNTSNIVHFGVDGRLSDQECDTALTLLSKGCSEVLNHVLAFSR